MAWEVRLFRRTRLGAFKNCLALIDAYSEFAPLWERVLLAAFAGLGPPLGHWFGGNTRTLWPQADSIVGDVLAASGMTPNEIAKALRQYVKLKRNENHELPFEKAQETIYDQPFYPLVTHFTLAFQPSAAARLRFVRRIVESIPSSEAIVADLGCGSGAILCEVLKLKTSWRGYGLDISEVAIDYARRLANHKNVAARVDLQTGSLSDLPYRNNSLDVVIASEVVEHLPNPARAFAEFSRVLAPGGMLIVTMPVESYSPAHMHALNNAEEFCALCEQAGLAAISVVSKWHVSYGDDRKHIFAVARRKHVTQSLAESAVYSLSLPQMSSAASSGMVSS
ncbi:MAG: class I SAM-dependent methyltransferase [Pyrinomonadaceae bacterium]